MYSDVDWNCSSGVFVPESVSLLAQRFAFGVSRECSRWEFYSSSKRLPLRLYVGRPSSGDKFPSTILLADVVYVEYSYMRRETPIK